MAAKPSVSQTCNTHGCAPKCVYRNGVTYSTNDVQSGRVCGSHNKQRVVIDNIQVCNRACGCGYTCGAVVSSGSGEYGNECWRTWTTWEVCF